MKHKSQKKARQASEEKLELAKRLFFLAQVMKFVIEWIQEHHR